MESPFDSHSNELWEEYAQVFHDFDDFSLARWMAQTLGQLYGRAWRMSHPLVGAYRLAAGVAETRQLWLKRLVTAPSSYPQAPCCPAPLVPLLTRDVVEDGFICQHCQQTAYRLDSIPMDIAADLEAWAGQYEEVHQVAHWNDRQRAAVPDYDEAFDAAGERAAQMLLTAGREIAPRLLDHFPTIIWEDQDECLDVRPEDI